MSKKNVLKVYLAKIMKGKSQADLATALNFTDIDSDLLLTGDRTITTQQAIVIAKFTDTDPSELLHKQTERDLAALGVQIAAKPAAAAPTTTTRSSSQSSAFGPSRARPTQSTCR